MSENLQPPVAPPEVAHHFTNNIVKTFLESNLALVLILLAAVVGLAALFLTPREEDPQIVVPLADVYVNFPGHSAREIEQLVAAPLEKILYQIDGVEYVYSMSQEGQAIITVRYYVGEDRERSLVKLYKKIDENLASVPPGVTGWVVKPVEIDDVPIVTLTLTAKAQDDLKQKAKVASPKSQIDKMGGVIGVKDQRLGAPDSYTLRRVAEELSERLAAVPNLSRTYVIGGQPRVVRVELDPDQMQAFHVSPVLIQQAIQGANVTVAAGDFTQKDRVFTVDVGRAFARSDELRELVVAVHNDRPVFLKDVATIIDGPAETTSYVRHAWGPAHGFAEHAGAAGTVVGEIRGKDGVVTGASSTASCALSPADLPASAVTIALAKKKGANAVWVARDVIKKAAELQKQVVPDNLELVITRNSGVTADDKVNELVEALVVAIIIVIALLTLSLGWREALIVAVAVPVVFGLTLAVNLLAGFSINRVTLFALILALGLLVDDPIVDVENISRHFANRKKATRRIVLEAVAEIRPPLVAATLAVILSFLPMFFITGMMGPYMRPMALNVPVTMVMSMLVAFTITPWMAYHVLKKHYPAARGQGPAAGNADPRPQGGAVNPPLDVPTSSPAVSHQSSADLQALRQTFLWKLFYPLMAPLLHHRWLSWTFLFVMGLLTMLAMGLAATRHVPLKMLPFDNKNELLLVLDLDRGTTLERTDAAVRDFTAYLRTVPEVVDVTSYVGVASPMDFNGLVRHYYLRQGDNVAELRINLVNKKNRAMQSHAIGLRLRDDLTRIADQHHAKLKIVETPPGPPVLATLVAEVYGQPYHHYADLLAAAQIVRQRMRQEPLVVDTDDISQASQTKYIFVIDQEKAALNGVSVARIAQTVQTALGGQVVGTVHCEGERNPLRIELRLPRALRSSPQDLAQLHVLGGGGQLIALAELGKWEKAPADQTIYHKNLQRVAYVFADTAGRAPAEAIVDIQADRQPFSPRARVVRTLQEARPNEDTFGGQYAPSHPNSLLAGAGVRPLAGRTFFSNGSHIPWAVPAGIRVDFAGEGEWNITLDVFRDLGLAFGAALVAIYILLLWQTGSFVIPGVVMLAIPLTVLGVMPGFWLLNVFTSQNVGGYPDPVFFTATGMIGMIALSGIVTRDSIILVDFIHLSLKRGRSLFDAIMESRVVRLRPILLTASAALLGAVPIITDPIFSGLAWALIFGLLASTAFTLFVIPVTYWLLYAHKPGHGLPLENEE